MDKDLKTHIQNSLGITINRVRAISGGDISHAYLLETELNRFFCKLNRDTRAYEMFLSEKLGLEAILKTKAIAVPKVLLCEKLEIGGLLLMEYIEPKRPSKNDMELFGHQLASLHRSFTKLYGQEGDNYIGNLKQSNRFHAVWHEFYVQERLLPQFRLARDENKLSRGEIPSEEQLLETCENLFAETKPSLLHGDLWSGNYLISQEGAPYLIDPAIYYGHYEVDIAMTKLFGGFDASFYDAYAEHFPKLRGEKERTEIYQLYYLLVHLNLFGSSYKSSVIKILETYF